MLQLSNIQLGYSRAGVHKPVFVPFSAAADRGELVALTGKNGQGKSTLLRTIAGLQKCLSGQILFQQKNLSTCSVRQLATLMSYVSTEKITVDNLKVFDFVALGRYPYLNWWGKLTAGDKDIVEHALQTTGMLPYAWKNIRQLSDGEQQRVILARALAQNTPLILLDEPTAFLDFTSRYQIIALLKTLAVEQQKIILFSTHDLPLAVKIAHQMWVMDNEFYAATPAALLQNGTLRSVFVASGKGKIDPFENFLL